MKNKQKKNALDEMQERNLLKLEEVGFWIVFWSLLASIIIQFIIKPDIKTIAGEAAVLLIASIYIACSSIRKGLWTKNMVPTRRINAVTSIIPAILLGAIHIVRTFVVLGKDVTAETVVTISIRTAVAYLLCFAVLEIMRFVYKKKREELDDSKEE